MPSTSSLKDLYNVVRNLTEKLCQPLETEDFVVQPITDVSPPKWHLAHTTWFFETFVLKKFSDKYTEFHPQYNYMFNSYYVGVGDRAFRADRGFMTRPTVSDIMNYRKHIDEAMIILLENELDEKTASVIEIGLHHEQQHQELLIYDIKFILGNNPMFPQYLPIKDVPSPVRHKDEMLQVDEGVYNVGHKGEEFHFDNEAPNHQVFLHSYSIMDRLVTNEEYVQFIEDGGYADHRLWFMEAHEWAQENKIEAPLHWHKMDGIWHRYALRGGLKPIDPKAPVTHISMYEADAFAKWSGKRLPTEFEWEIAANMYGDKSGANFVENENYEPMAVGNKNKQFYGDAWEWTNSSYLPYPGYKAPEGAIGEYNGKFMINQMVLKGGSCASPNNHLRSTYRNFFHPDKRWIFSGIRLAESL